MRMHLGIASSSHASAVSNLPDRMVQLALMELQKLQTRISEEESISSSLSLLKPHFRAVVMDVGGVLCASPLVGTKILIFMFWGCECSL